MPDPTDRRRGASDPRKAAEALFRKAPPPAPTAAKPATLPGVKETVTLKVDRHILDHFQKDGPGWQDRMVATLRAAVPAEAAIPVEDLNASNDE